MNIMKILAVCGMGFGSSLMLKLLFLAVLTYVIAWCVFWILAHAVLLVIAALCFGGWSWWQSKNRQNSERP